MFGMENYCHAAIGSTYVNHRDTETQRTKTGSPQSERRSIRRRGPAGQAHRAAVNSPRERARSFAGDSFPRTVCGRPRRYAARRRIDMALCLCVSCGLSFSAGSAPHTCARTFSRNTRLARAFAIVSSAVAPTLQHSTMIGPSNPAAFRVLNTAAKSTLPVPN